MAGDERPLVTTVRRAVRAENLQWRVSYLLDDDDRVPVYPLGAEPEGLPEVGEVPPVDFQAVVARSTTNPFLARLARTAGLPADPLGRNPGTALDVMALPAAAALPTSVDWRFRWGWPWVTTIRDQDPCQACWAFTAVALVEAMNRIEHCVWTHRSEGDVHKGMGATCPSTGDFANALNHIRSHGVCDPGCFPWTPADIAHTPCFDRVGRTIGFDRLEWVGTMEDQKRWLHTVGPLATFFQVHNDFFAYGGGVYQPSSGSTAESSHAVLIVGYDDADGCWIAKNSWGPGWGDNGYFRIKYGVCDVDKRAKIGITGTDPDPLTRRRLHNGCFFESGGGTLHRDFELLAKDGTRLHQWVRSGDHHPYPWNRVATFATDVGSHPAYTATTFGRNQETVYSTTGGRLHHWWREPATGPWHDGGVFGPTDAAGIPGFIQGNYGSPANFEVVVGTTSGQFNHWWRDLGGWHDGGRHGNNISHVGPALVQGRDGPFGSLELLVVLGDSRLQHWWRNDDQHMTWSVRDTFGEDGYESAPCMIESQFGAAHELATGNYEMCVVRGDKIEHWWRWNGGDRQWRHSTTFGGSAVAVLGMTQGSWGFNLELVALRTDGRLQHYWRDLAGWHAGVIVA